MRRSGDVECDAPFYRSVKSARKKRESLYKHDGDNEAFGEVNGSWWGICWVSDWADSKCGGRSY